MATLTAKGLERRNDILAAADELFRKNGYENTTLRMIAQEVHISCGHLEHYFKEKKDLIYNLSEILIQNIWDTSILICRDWEDDPYVIYAFAVHWLFLVCSHLPDVRHITFEYVKYLDNQLAFSERFARHFIEILDSDETDTARIQTAVNMSFSAQLCCLQRYNDQSFSDEIARQTSYDHIRILFLLLGHSTERAEQISLLVCEKIDSYTIERLTKPFSKTYRWYQIEGHSFEF